MPFVSKDLRLFNTIHYITQSTTLSDKIGGIR